MLETLAERIAGGEVDDLLGRLPVQLHPPLKRGKAQGPGTAERMSVEKFLRRVAEREGVRLDQAAHDVLKHTQAVFATLREAVGEELFDVVAQLPRDYSVLLVPSQA